MKSGYRKSEIQSAVPDWPNVFVSTAFAASSVLSICVSGLVPPECKEHGLPASTPHVGQGTVSEYSELRSEIPIQIGYGALFHKTVQLCTFAGKPRPMRKPSEH